MTIHVLSYILETRCSSLERLGTGMVPSLHEDFAHLLEHLFALLFFLGGRFAHGDESIYVVVDFGKTCSLIFKKDKTRRETISLNEQK